MLSNRMTLVILCSLAIFIGFAIRLISILPGWRKPPPRRKRGSPTALMVVLGSGGHTSEMLYMLEDIDLASFTHRAYVVSTGDSFSLIKAKEFENSKEQRIPKFSPEWTALSQISTTNRNETLYANAENSKDFEIHVVPRARLIYQSLLTTPFSAFRCLVACTQLLIRESKSQQKYPDIIITNGPGTAAVLVGAALLLRFVNLHGANKPDCMRIIYVESWARIRTLSLTGRLLLPLVDRFIVQWKELEVYGRKCEYHGPLVFGNYQKHRHLKIER